MITKLSAKSCFIRHQLNVNLYNNDEDIHTYLSAYRYGCMLICVFI